MPPVWSALLQSWSWRIDLIIVLAMAGTIYTWGWLRLRRRTHGSKHRLATDWRLASYLGGLAVLAVALMSPIDVLGQQLFTFHMVQHLLLIMIAAPLLLLANPFPFLLWGLPKKIRLPLAGLFNPRATFRRALRATTRPMFVWLAFIIVYVGWHDPNAYNAALIYPFVHDLEHLTFFATAMLFWWHVIAAGPRIHGRFPIGMRIGYLALTIPPNMLTGVAIAFTGVPIYTYYTTVPRLFGLTVMQDQMISGVIMWVPGSMMYIVAILILAARLLQDESDKPPLPEEVWATDEGMIAPGWDRK